MKLIYKQTDLLISWLLISGKYFMHNQDKNKFNNYQKLSKVGVGLDTTWQQFLTDIEKSEQWEWAKNSAFCSLYTTTKRI